MKPHRQRRVEELLKEVLSELIRELKDPRIGFVTITHILLTPDLRQAKVLVSVLGNEKEQTESVNGLKNACGFIRKRLGEQIRLKFTPEIDFFLDDSIKEGSRIIDLINRLSGPGQ